ncbi:MAG TPA: FUN14 domain-containing protein [Terriglobales bacterium]|nr:FUN14 domain-containing protein [Terriglobales bacterium]
MDDGIFGSLTAPLAELGFGGVAGWAVGYTAKKIAKLAALVVGVFFIGVQLLAYYGVIDVRWDALQSGAEQLWQGEHGASLAQRAWHVITYNLPFGGGFVAGFALGIRRG